MDDDDMPLLTAPVRDPYESTILLTSNNESADYYSRKNIPKQMLFNKPVGFVQSLNIDPTLNLANKLHQLSIKEVKEDSDKNRTR